MNVSLFGRHGWVVFVLFAVVSLPAYGDLIGALHRGGRIQGPENTLEVFQLSLDLGVNPWFETDTWVSSDGVLVIHHDLDMCRTTNIGTLPGFDCVVAANNPLGRLPWIRDFTLAELKALDVGSWFSPAFAGAVMPTLEEAMFFLDGTGVPLLIEIKSTGQAPLIEEILTRTGLSADNIIIWAREPYLYDQFYVLLPGVRQITGIVAQSVVTDAFLADRAAKGDFGIGFTPAGLTQELMDKIHSYGFLSYSVPASNGQDPVLQQIPLGIDAFHVTDELDWEQFLSTRPCLDRLDNDGDGFADFDGIDFDFDGIPDVPPDPACAARLDTSEVAECQDLIDNDGDGFIDLADSACVTPNSLSETVFVPSCGDGIISAPETCDDGNVLAGDGCYSSCRIEDSVELFGVAEGGSVSVTVSSVVIPVTTNFGETAAQVVANLETAVNVNPTLQGLGLSAAGIGDSLFTDGIIDSLTISDVGLSDVPLPVCGDGIISAPETCDDGNVLAGDGCYSSCRIEDSVELFGVAEGGSVSVTVSSVVIPVTTNFGETAAQVVANLETAVNVNPTLQGLGLSAAGIGDSLFTDGIIDSLTISDVGLSDVPLPAAVPALTPMSWLVLAFSLAGCWALVSRHRQRELS